MTKKIVVVTGEYQKQDGTKGANFTEVGIINTSQNGKEYSLLDPAVDLAGLLLKQNAIAAAKGEPPRDMVMCSVIQRQQSAAPAPAPQQGGYNQQPAPQQNYNQTPRQQYNQRPGPQPQQGNVGFDDDINF